MNILQLVERYSFYSFNITAYMSKDMSHYQRNPIRIIWYCRDWASFLVRLSCVGVDSVFLEGTEKVPL